MNNASLYMAISCLFAAIVSAFVVIRGQKETRVSSDRGHSNEEVRTIFDGYSQIVDELRIEVERLMLTIALLQEEQAVCEERNNELLREVGELKSRLSQLEGRNGTR